MPGTTTLSSAAEAARFADQLERSFHGGAWHGPALAEALAGVDAGLAASHPIRGAHSIAEIAFHAGYWIDAAQRRIDGRPLDPGPDDADWQAPRALDAETWRAVVAKLEAAHRGLHGTVAALGDSRLEDPVEGSDPTVRGMLLGLLQHNAYHAGQISLLRRAAEATDAAGGSAA